MKFGLLMGTILLALGLMAQPRQTIKPHTYLTELPPELQTDFFKNARSSVQEYQLYDNKKDLETKCSLTVVSNTCYALTSAHCLINFLDSKKLINWAKVDARYTVGRVAQNQIRNLELPFIQQSVRLVAIGDGNFENIPSTDLIEHENLVSDKDIAEFVKTNHFGYLADFALLKLPGDNCTCVKTADFEPGTNVVVVGFAGENYPRIGNTVAPFGESAISIGQQCEPQMTQFIEQKRKDLYENLKNEFIFHNARSKGGTSGGALLNPNSELIGINTFSQAGLSGYILNLIKFDSPLDDINAALSTKFIKEKLKETLPPEIFEEAFKCEPKVAPAATSANQ